MLSNCKNNCLLPESSRKVNLLMPWKRFEELKFYVYANVIIWNGALAPDMKPRWLIHSTIMKPYMIHNDLHAQTAQAQGVTPTGTCKKQGSTSRPWFPEPRCTSAWTNTHWVHLAYLRVKYRVRPHLLILFHIIALLHLILTWKNVPQRANTSVQKGESCSVKEKLREAMRI